MAGSNGVVDTRDVTRFRRLKRVRVVGGKATTTGKPITLPPGTILPPPDYESTWRNEQLDTQTMNSMTPARLLELLVNLSPEVSKGNWDYMRLLNPGWSYTANNVGTDTPNARAKVTIDTLLDVLKRRYGSMDVVIGKMHMGAYMRGGYFAEIVFDEAGKTALDIATPDPVSVRFKVKADPVLKEVWQLGQWQNGTFVPLDEKETVAYAPIDSFPGSPYGRPLISPALFSALFLLGLLHDLRRVISQQGWPRIDIVLNTDKLLESLSAEDKENEDEVLKVLEQAVEDVRGTYKGMEPDDAYIHTDEVEIKGTIGVTDGASLTGIGPLIEVVERMLTRALKTMPLMLAITDGVSEANANRQWEIMVAGVKAMQHLCESILERFMELACNAQGVQAEVKWQFAEIRSSEAQRDALTRSQEIDNETKLRNEGITTQEEMADNLVKHEPAAEGPVYGTTTPLNAQPNDANPDPGTLKFIESSWRLLMPAWAATRVAYRDTMVRRGDTVTVERLAPGQPVPRDGRMWTEAGVWMKNDDVVWVEYDTVERAAATR